MASRFSALVMIFSFIVGDLAGMIVTHEARLAKRMGRSVSNQVYGEISFVGATPNFFKAGHTTIRSISTSFPQVRMRLGLISEVKKIPPIVEDLEKTGQLSYHTWPLGDYRPVKSRITGEEMTAEMDGLVNFFHGSTAAFLVPPIENRLEIGSKYAQAVAIAKVPYVVILGVQYSSRAYKQKYSEDPPQITKDAEQLYEEINRIFTQNNSPTKYIIFHLPMFLENILYQTNRLRDDKSFYWPLNRDAQFGYISCKDLGIVVSEALTNFEDFVAKLESQGDNNKGSRWDLAIIGGVTTAAELEQDFKKIVDNKIEYKEQSRISFIQELKNYLGKSEEAANTIAELYDEIAKGRDLLASDTLLLNLAYQQPMTAYEWICEHKECFKIGGQHNFPLPPLHHQAPSP